MLKDFIKRFDSEVAVDNIRYDWDAGWCYSSIDHPIMQEAERAMGYSSKEYEQFEDYANTWLSENEGYLYHRVDIEGDKLVSQAETLKGDAAVAYAKGLVDYIEKYGGDSSILKKEKADLEEFIKNHSK